MSGDPRVNEWTLVRERFEALVHERADNIEDVLDALFPNRVSELIAQATECQSRTKDEAKPI